MVKLSISILGNKGIDPLESALLAENYAIDSIHLDVMDGKFVEPTEYCPQTLKILKEKVKLPIDVHLMAVNPEELVEQYFDLNPNSIAIHFEASTPEQLVDNLSLIKKSGCKVGLAINPKTKFKEIDEKAFKIIDYLLIMSVQPGYSGQEFIESSFEKIAQYDQISSRMARRFEIYVDGGINSITGKNAISKGADGLVIGSAFYNSENKFDFINEFKID